VRERVEEQGVSVPVAVKDLNDAIKADEGLQPAFASKLLALTAAVREETILAGKLDQHDALSGIAEKDLWRLVAPAKGQADDDKWLADSVNQGSLAGMLRGFGHMIEAQEQGEPITTESLAELHGDMTAGTFKMGIDIDEDSMRFPQGLRDGEGTDLGLDGGGVVTDAGRAELRDAAAKEPWFKLRDGDDGDVSLEFAPKSGEEVRARADSILASYEKEKAAATTPEEKRLAVARATQDLYRSHLFQDGNTRTVVFLTMNRLLLDAGLGPAILAEPRAAAGYSLREFAGEIEKVRRRLRHSGANGGRGDGGCGTD
jgi:Fic/DOC family